jgi:UDPglucose 6-dehydrogenase
VDKNEGHIKELSENRMPIYEPGLEELVMGSARRGCLRFSTELDPVVHEADILFIAVDTPQGNSGSVNLSSVEAVARSIGMALSEARRSRPLVVVNKSTVPVGSGDYVSMLIQEGTTEAGNGTVDYQVVSNPEFLREGSAIYD